MQAVADSSLLWYMALDAEFWKRARGSQFSGHSRLCKDFFETPLTVVYQGCTNFRRILLAESLNHRLVFVRLAGFGKGSESYSVPIHWSPS